MPREQVIAITLALALVACGDGTSPRQTTVEVNLVEQLGPTVSTDPEAGTLISCEVQLRGTAHRVSVT